MCRQISEKIDGGPSVGSSNSRPRSDDSIGVIGIFVMLLSFSVIKIELRFYTIGPFPILFVFYIFI